MNNYSTLSVNDKKVYIAKEALKLLECEFFTLGSTYLGMDGTDYELNTSFKNFLEIKRKCFGCALGGLFVAHVLTVDVKLEEFDVMGFRTENMALWGEPIFKELGECFTEKELRMIESAYEQYNMGYSCGFKDECELASQLYRNQEPQERFKAICENIINNKGEFKIGN